MDIFSGDVKSQLEVLLQVAIAMGLGGVVGTGRFLHAHAGRWRGGAVYRACRRTGRHIRQRSLCECVTHRAHAHRRGDHHRRQLFLGAGTIFHARSGSIEGLTTAASILLVSAIGIAVALNQFVLALSVTVLALFVLTTLRLVENLFARRRD